MAPEQAQGATVDTRSDLFSLGCVLYRMATGTMPFQGSDSISTLLSVVAKDPPPPSEQTPSVPPALSALIMQLLAKQPDDRPASAQAVGEALRALNLAPAMPGCLPDPNAASVRAAGRRWRWLVAALVLALVPLSYFFGGTAIRVATNKGELVIENADPNIEVRIKGATVTIDDRVRDRSFVLTAGDYDVEVREQDAGGLRFATRKLTITRGGKEVFNARLELAKAAAPVADPERRAAEWVLKVRGKLMVEVKGETRSIKEPAQLPGEPFTIVRINIDNNLARLTDDTWLDNLRGLKKPPTLGLIGVPVTEATVERLAQLPGAEDSFSLDLIQVTLADATVASLKRIRGLGILQLAYCKISLPSLTHVREFPSLYSLDLRGGHISDIALTELRDLIKLEHLALPDNPRITDAGLEQLQGLNRLKRLILTKTSVTAVGVRKLHAALPKCRIESDHGTFEAAK
jgi:hypothetical protein